MEEFGALTFPLDHLLRALVTSESHVAARAKVSGVRYAEKSTLWRTVETSSSPFDAILTVISKVGDEGPGF